MAVDGRRRKANTTRTGSETQLTGTIAGLCRRDQSLAAPLSRAILRAAADAGNAAAARMLANHPPAVSLSSGDDIGPVDIGRWTQRGGLLDWRFSSTGFDLVVEVKVGAKLGDRQLERYLSYVDSSEPGTVAGLVLLTRDHVDIPKKVRRGSRWLGQVHWSQLLPVLGDITPEDETVASEWVTLLDNLSQPGWISPEPARWQLNGQNTSERNRRVLREVEHDAVAKIETLLRARKSGLAAKALCTAKPARGYRAVTGSGGVARINFFIPRNTPGDEAVVVVLSGTRRPLTLEVHVDPGPTPVFPRAKRNHQAALAELRASGFEVVGPRLATQERVGRDTPDVPPHRAVATALDSRLEQIVSSGVLDWRL